MLATRQSARSRTSAPGAIRCSPKATGTASTAEIRKAVPASRKVGPRNRSWPHVLPGQEEQEAEAQQVQHLSRALRADQAQDLRSDDDPDQHFEYHGRHQPPRHQPGDQRRHESGHRHHEQPAILDRH